MGTLTLLGIGGLLFNRALRRVPTPEAFPSRSDRLPAAGACLEDAAVGWGRRPADEKRLTRVKAGRARAFLERASSAGANLDAFSTPRAVERNFFKAGPPSSAEERAREEGMTAPFVRW